MKSRNCELCSAAAAVFCPSDAAFLCWTCDSEVHGANFLVARHVRRPVCSGCGDFTGQGVSGAGFPLFRAVCPSGSPASDEEHEDGVVSSDCISSTTSPGKGYSGGRGDGGRGSKRKRGGGGNYSRAEGVFVDWCGKLGVRAGVAVQIACRGLSAWSSNWTALPFRVCLAASMWLGLRLSGDESAGTWRVLKRLEEISGVPAKIIVAAEMKMERGERRRRLELEEGWAEC